MRKIKSIVVTFVATLIIATSLPLTAVVYAAPAPDFYETDVQYDSYDDVVAAWNQFVSDYNSDRFHVSYDVECAISTEEALREAISGLSQYINEERAQHKASNCFTLTEYNLFNGSFEMNYGGSYDGTVVTAYYDVTFPSNLRGTVEEINNARATAASIASQWNNLDSYNQVLAIVEWLCENADYDYESANQDMDRGHSIGSCIFDGLCVCEGYAQAFQAMAESLGIESYIVTGDLEGGGHAWNAVKIDGNYYFVDATNADQDWGVSYRNIVFGSNTASEDYLYYTALDISETDYAPLYVTNMIGHSVTLNDGFVLNYYYQFSDNVITNPEAYVHFQYADGSYVDVPVCGLSQTYVNEISRYAYVVSCDVAARQMRDIICASVVIPDGISEGVDWVNSEKGYSICDYAAGLFERASTNADYAEAASLVGSMLTYGTYSQLYFGYNTDNLAIDLNNSNAASIDGITVDYLVNYAEYACTQGNQVQLTSVSLTLKSKTSLGLYFTIPEGVTADSVVFISGEYELPTQAVNDNTVYVDVANISANELDSVYAVDIYVDGVFDSSVNMSPLTYCYLVLSTDTTSAELQNLVCAICVYNMRADAYFG